MKKHLSRIFNLVALLLIFSSSGIVVAGEFPNSIVLVKGDGEPASNFKPSVPEAIDMLGEEFKTYFNNKVGWSVYIPLNINEAHQSLFGDVSRDLLHREIAGFYIDYAANPEYTTRQEVITFQGTVVQIMRISNSAYWSYIAYVKTSKNETIRINMINLKLLYRR